MKKYDVLAAFLAVASLTAAASAFGQVAVPAAMAIPAQPLVTLGHEESAGANNGQTAPQRDASHDFDFNVGTWRTHIQALQEPLSGKTAWSKMEGTVTIRKLTNGEGLVEEIEASGAGGAHFEGMTLYLYNPQSKQWSQAYADKSKGALEPPTIGGFKNGRGELYGADTVNGRRVLVRGLWSEITQNSHRYEIAYSVDRGKTWETNFIGNLERLKP